MYRSKFKVSFPPLPSSLSVALNVVCPTVADTAPLNTSDLPVPLTSLASAERLWIVGAIRASIFAFCSSRLVLFVVAIISWNKE